MYGDHMHFLCIGEIEYLRGPRFFNWGEIVPGTIVMGIGDNIHLLRGTSKIAWLESGFL